MLVLKRNRDEVIVIGDGPNKIEVMVVECPDWVRLGITAPKDVPVHRKEIYDLIQSQRNGANQ